MTDLGAPSSYLALQPGTSVYSSDGEKLGEVQLVLADAGHNVFDGIVIDASALPGGPRFADADQIAEIFERGVVLRVSSGEAGELPEPSENPGVLEVTRLEDVDHPGLSDRLRRAWDMISGKR